MIKEGRVIEFGVGNYETCYLVELELKAVNLEHVSMTETLWSNKQNEEGELQHFYGLQLQT